MLTRRDETRQADRQTLLLNKGSFHSFSSPLFLPSFPGSPSIHSLQIPSINHATPTKPRQSIQPTTQSTKPTAPFPFDGVLPNMDFQNCRSNCVVAAERKQRFDVEFVETMRSSQRDTDFRRIYVIAPENTPHFPACFRGRFCTTRPPSQI
jgi:hypothetical protein